MFRYGWAGAAKVSTPAARFSVVAAVPSPQSTVTVCVSKVPGSAKLPLSVVAPFSLIVAAVRLNCRLFGATLSTVTVVAPVALAPSPSVTVTPIV